MLDWEIAAVRRILEAIVQKQEGNVKLEESCIASRVILS